MSENDVSEPVKIPEDGILRLGRETPNPEMPGEMIFITIAQAQVAKDVSRALVILVPYPKPHGDLLFATKVQNLTTSEIGIHFGNDKILVKSGGSGIRSGRDLKADENQPLAYNYRSPVEQE